MGAGMHRLTCTPVHMCTSALEFRLELTSKHFDASNERPAPRTFAAPASIHKGIVATKAKACNAMAQCGGTNVCGGANGLRLLERKSCRHPPKACETQVITDVNMLLAVVFYWHCSFNSHHARQSIGVLVCPR